jgi:hypothetical protein
MKPSLLIGSALLVLAAGTIAGCTSPSEASACPEGTTEVTASVTKSGSNVVFDWAPRCPVALLLVEQEASDMWVVNAPNFSETSTTAANVIFPSVTYGQTPSGSEVDAIPKPLVAGTTYNLVLWMVVPSSTNCVTMRVQNACLVALKSFVK